MLWRDLKAFQIYGANTDVGKTVVSTLLCKALKQRGASDGAVLYLKPVSTGPRAESDVIHVSRYVPGVKSRNISQFSLPVSPHIASRVAGESKSIPRSNQSILENTKNLLAKHAANGGRYALLETAGGILSPAPSGALQADLYRSLRLPVILVGDHKLGGIATTISAFESLHLRGYDVDAVILFQDRKYKNDQYLRGYFQKHGISTFAIPKPPPKLPSESEPVAEDPGAERVIPESHGIIRIVQSKLRGKGDLLSESSSNRSEDTSRLRDLAAMGSYYSRTADQPALSKMIDMLQDKHFTRISKLTSMPHKAESVIWHPFRQHGLPQDLVAIDSAYRDHFETYRSGSDQILQGQSDSPGLQPASASFSSSSLLTPLFDGSASWWTQGLGHGNPELALTAAYAAGRYGHVMFANAVHEPALELSYNLLSTLANPRLTRVFFTDNGSTGMEVAVKMALRASGARYGWHKDDGKREIGILGLAGSYHGDTIGVMNCSEPNVYNESVDWYKPWGHWFDPPSVQMRKGRWELTRPPSLSGSDQEVVSSFSSLDELFHFADREQDTETYEVAIKTTLNRLVHDEGRRFGALILEPIIMGAGGMIFVDPLFQRTLIKTIRENPNLIAPSDQSAFNANDSISGVDWSGVPIIADEVFTGLFRLGRASSSSFLGPTPSQQLDRKTIGGERTHSAILQPKEVAPDISVHAKLLTGGLLPLALTTASESIFKTFLSDRKQDALLHGHSYTAHAVGCAVANKSLKMMEDLTRSERDRAQYYQQWAEHNKMTEHSTSLDNTNDIPENARLDSKLDSEGHNSPTPAIAFSFFSPGFLTTLSHHPRISGCWALGTVLAMTLASNSGSGYTSTATTTLQSALLTQLNSEGQGIHSRVLGDVLYLMTSLKTRPRGVKKVEEAVLKALG